jgi:hypothetical protein
VSCDDSRNGGETFSILSDKFQATFDSRNNVDQNKTNMKSLFFPLKGMPQLIWNGI